MPRKGASTAIAPTRLPPLPKLRIRRPNRAEENPCIGIMTSMLGKLYNALVDTPGSDLLCAPIADPSLRIGCWASSGYSVSGCASLEQQLRACMDQRVSAFVTVA